MMTSTKANSGRRVRLKNEHIALAFDRRTGELVELCNNRTGENLLKNWSAHRSMPFCLLLANAAGETLKLVAPTYHQVLSDPGLSPAFQEAGDGAAQNSLTITYPRLYTEKGAVDIQVEITVSLPQNDEESIWEMQLTCGESFNEVLDGARIHEVRFPCVFGLYHGRSWKDDTLVYPFNSGEKIVNPVETYARTPAEVGWKWQQYKYRYYRDGIATTIDDDGAHFREYRYSGPLSMMWLDYYEQEQGFYLASYDPAMPVSALHAETFGPDKPGMGFYIAKYPDLRPGDSWSSAPAGVAVHPGDWHWGADRYRGWHHASTGSADTAPDPDWLQCSSGLVAHYDFKYQSGDIVHRFSDLGRLYAEAQEMGLNDLLLSGWHIDGFDHGFPQYRPDPDLGTTDELCAQIAAVHEHGGRVGFYINSRLVNRKYNELSELVERAGVHNLAGELKTECYGDDDIEFAVMSPNEEEWRERVFDAVRFLAQEAGADFVYLDQLAMSPPQLCRERGSQQGIDWWNAGYRKLLEKIRHELDIAVFYEGVSDIHGPQANGQLISTFFYHYTGAFPELYRYTFPAQRLIDMVYPERGQAMRPVHISQASREMIDRAFMTGCYLWAYDLEDENSFRDDPQMMAYLKDVIALRRHWLKTWGLGEFRDDVAFTWLTPKGTSAKHFALNEKSDLLVIADASDSGRWSVWFDTRGRSVARAHIYRLGLPDKAEPLEISQHDGNAVELHDKPVELHDACAAPLAIVCLEYTEPDN